MIAFVLSGGGNRGALEAGALLALFEQGIRPDMLVGSSVGALNAAFIAINPTLDGAQRLVDVWSKVRKEQIYPGNYLTMAWRFLRGEDGLFSNRPLRAFIEAHMPPGVRTFNDVSDVQLYIAATNLNTGRLHIFGDDPSDTIVDALMASTALPLYFPPWHYRGWQYVDGGTTCNVPICLALKRGAGAVYAIDVSCPDQPQFNMRGIATIAQRTIWAMSCRPILENISASVARSGTAIHHVVIGAFTSLSAWDFSCSQEMIKEGHRAMSTYLEEHPQCKEAWSLAT